MHQSAYTWSAILFQWKISFEQFAVTIGYLSSPPSVILFSISRHLSAPSRIHVFCNDCNGEWSSIQLNNFNYLLLLSSLQPNVVHWLHQVSLVILAVPVNHSAAVCLNLWMCEETKPWCEKEVSFYTQNFQYMRMLFPKGGTSTRTSFGLLVPSRWTKRNFSSELMARGISCQEHLADIAIHA